MPILSLGIGMVLTLETGVVSDHFFIIFHPWVSLSLGQALASLRRLQQSHPSLGRHQIRWQCLGLRLIGWCCLALFHHAFFHCFPIREISVLISDLTDLIPGAAISPRACPEPSGLRCDFGVASHASGS